jgi:hypothetical protein
MWKGGRCEGEEVERELVTMWQAVGVKAAAKRMPLNT